MAAGLRRNLVLPEAAGRRASCRTAGAGCQQAGIHAVGLLDEILRMRVKDKTAVAGMNLFHDLEPDLRRVSAIQAVQTVVMLIAYPDRRRVFRRYAAEPDIRVRTRGTGLARGLHAVDLNAVGGTVCGNVLQAVEHIIYGMDVGKALVGIRGVFKNGVALVVEHLRIGARTAEHAVVDEGRVGAGHFADRHAVGQRAERQRRQSNIRLDCAVLIGTVADQLDVELAGEEIIGSLRCQCVEHLYRDGVERARNTFLDGQGAAGRVLAVVHRPRHAVLALGEGAVVDRRARNDDARIHRRAVACQRLERGTRLAACIGREGERAAERFLAASACDRDDIALLVRDDHGAFRHFAVLFRIRERGIIGIYAVQSILDLGINGRMDLEAAGIYHILCDQLGITLLLLQIVDDVLDDLIGEVAVGGLDVLLVFLVGTVVQLLGNGRIVLVLGNHVLIEHLRQNGLLTRFYLVGMVIYVVDGRIVGQSGQNGAFRQVELRNILAEVTVCRGLHAVAVVAEVDGVEVHDEDAVLVIDLLFERKSTEDLVYLALDGVIFVLSDVFDELLRDRRAAVLVAAEHPALDRAERAPPVYAVMLVEALVLDGDDGVLEIVRNFVAVDPFAVLAALDGLINGLLACLRVRRIDERVEVQTETFADFGSSFLRGAG